MDKTDLHSKNESTNDKSTECVEIFEEKSSDTKQTAGEYLYFIAICFFVGLVVGLFAQGVLKHSAGWNEFINYINLYYPM